MLNLSMIAPIQFIEEANKYSGFMMTLAHLYDNPTYKQKVLDYVKQGGVVYLDNSFFELGKPIELSKLLDISREVGAKVIVLPDDNFGGVSEVLSSGFVPMLVPGSFNSAKQAFEIAKSHGLENIKVGISNIHAKKHYGISSLRGEGRHHFVRDVLGKIYENDLENILRFCRSDVLHFLGLDDNPWFELHLLSQLYEATLDSSAFVWPVLKEENFECITYREKKFKEPVLFDFNTSDERTISRLKNYLCSITQTLGEQKIFLSPLFEAYIY